MSSKKGSKPTPEANYQVSDIVLAKLRGYPPWPAMIVDPDKVSKAVKREKPPSKKTTFYCVRFFPAGDHSWAVAKDLSRLYRHEIEAYINEPSKKSGELKKGYEVALNPSEWEESMKKEQEEMDRAMEEQEETVDQLESDAGEDELEADEGENSDGTKKKKKDVVKKRKRDSVTAEDKKKKRKNASAALSATRRAIAGGKKVKGKALSSENVESEDEKGSEKADSNEGRSKDEPAAKKTPSTKSKSKKEPKAESPERPTKRSKKDKDDGDDLDDAALANDQEAQRVKEWRHKLQRAFLTAKSPPLAADMATYDQIFQAVENYEGLTIQYLTFSKIGKVMRRIASMENIPRDDEFHFKDRANKLVAQWQAIISKENGEEPPQAELNGTKASEPAAVSTNGARPGEPAEADKMDGKSKLAETTDVSATTTVNGIAESAVTSANKTQDTPMTNGASSVPAPDEDRMDMSD